MWPVFGPRDAFHVESRLSHTPALQRGGGGQHRTARRGQRGKWRGERFLLRHTDVKHLPGLLPGWEATQGGQTKRHAPRLLDLAHAVLLGQAEQRCDRSGADRQANVVEAERRGRPQGALQSAHTLAAYRPRRDRVDQRPTLGERVVREALSCASLLAGPPSDGIGSHRLDQRLPRGERVEAEPQWRAGGARLGAACGGEGEHTIGPGDQTVPRPTARFGVDRGRRAARQQRVCARARDTAARGHHGRTVGGILRAPLEPLGDGMGESVDGGACQPLRLQEADGFVPIASAVLAVRGGAAHDGDEAPEPRGAGVARPGGGH